MAYQPKVGKTRWRSLVAEQQQRNREMIVDLERLLKTAPNAEAQKSILHLIIAAQENLLALADLAVMHEAKQGGKED